MRLKPRRFYERKGECSRFLASRISNEVQWDKMCEKENIPSWLHGKSCSQRSNFSARNKVKKIFRQVVKY